MKAMAIFAYLIAIFCASFGYALLFLFAPILPLVKNYSLLRVPFWFLSHVIMSIIVFWFAKVILGWFGELPSPFLVWIFVGLILSNDLRRISRAKKGTSHLAVFQKALGEEYNQSSIVSQEWAMTIGSVTGLIIAGFLFI